MTALAFEKYEGLGNDFVVLTGAATQLSLALVPTLCDRRFGIGADGVLLVLPPTEGGAARMKVHNADGSVPEMCGNGLRCVALQVLLAQGRREGEVAIETDAGLRVCRVSGVHDGVGEVDVDMGVVRVTGQTTLPAAGLSLDLTLADAGNPHAVAYRDDPAADLPRVGPVLTSHPAFPHGTNVELVRWVGEVLECHVWERGVGPTLACGTGACGVVAVAVSRHEAPSGAPIRVRLPGGDLLITHDARTGKTRMSGPARRVYRGDWR